MRVVKLLEVGAASSLERDWSFALFFSAPDQRPCRHTLSDEWNADVKENVKKRADEAEQEFYDLVMDVMDKRGVSKSSAMRIARRQNPQLYKRYRRA